MAAFEPWSVQMNIPRRTAGDASDTARGAQSHSRESSFDGGAVPNTTYAAFSPSALSGAPPISAAKRRSTILVHQKSPLLLATPPQITRALAYSHPFLLPLNKLAGLLSWTTGDAWESFLLVIAWWAVVLYGGVVVKFAAPVLLAVIIMVAMYGRRFSPLSSGKSREPSGLGEREGDKHDLGQSRDSVQPSSKAIESLRAHTRSVSSLSNSEQTSTRHQKTLDEMIETLKEFTRRCNILLEPLLELTDFLSTQRTPTSATTRPALIALFLRLLLFTPIWAALTLPPLQVVTTRRVLLVAGTIMLTWHAAVMKASRALLWRSKLVRRAVALITGLQVHIPSKHNKTTSAKQTGSAVSAVRASEASIGTSPDESELTKALKRARGTSTTGVRFTFILYENQRRWVGLGWTHNLFAYERSAWTDEHQNAVTQRNEFELPQVEDGSKTKWQWAEDSRWRVDGVPDEAVSSRSSNDAAPWDYDGDVGRNGWVYYDNQWQNGRRGQDGWGRWTRRRKWYRDAELVEADEDMMATPRVTPATPTASSSPPLAPTLPPRPRTPSGADLSVDNEKSHMYMDSPATSPPRSSRFRLPSLRRKITDTSAATRLVDGDNASTTGVEHGSPSMSHRSRRMSDVGSDDEVLSPAVGAEIHRQHARDQWGVGDEVRMGLE